MNGKAVILQAQNVSVEFPARGGRTLKAVSDVSLNLFRGEVFGLVGESGSGKTTFGRALMRLVDLSAGSVHFENTDVSTLSRNELRSLRRRVQVVFQDPFGSLNPRMNVESILKEAIALSDEKESVDARIGELLDLVGLPTGARSRYPHEFSGGQRQRICIARALAVRPEVIIADEPVAALDVSIQAQIVNLLQDLQRDLQLTMLFIAHDLAVVRHISDRIGVMYLGRMQELGPAEQVIASPKHPYTQALLSAVPVPDPTRRSNRQILEGELPSPIDPPSGCVFRTRCPQADAECARTTPELKRYEGETYVACLHV